MVKVVFGAMGSSVATGANAFLADKTSTTKVLNLLSSYGVKEIDTARVYGAGHSESVLGEAEAHKDFLLQTKAPGFSPGSLSALKVRENCLSSLSALRQQKLDIYYLHGPDPTTPLAETLSTIDELYREGKFTKFGISNYASTAIQEIYDICQAKGYIRPTVYQGGYNPILRTTDKTRLPLCRKLGIAFYAYSPLAGGFLAKPLSQITNPAKGSRFEAMSVFGDIYCREEFIAGVERLKAVLDRHDMTVKNATLRWFMHHSPLGEEDAVILGASSLAQLESNLDDCRGDVLPQDVVAAIEDLWTSIEDVKIPYETEQGKI